MMTVSTRGQPISDDKTLLPFLIHFVRFQLGMLAGTLLSPYIFDAVSYYGCYGIAIALSGLMAGYFMFFVKEIPRPDNMRDKFNQPPNGHKEISKVHQHERLGNKHNLPPPYKPKHSVNYDTASDYTNDEYIDQSCCNRIFEL